MDNIQSAIIRSDYDFHTVNENNERTKIRITVNFNYPDELSDRLTIKDSFKLKSNDNKHFVIKCQKCGKDFHFLQVHNPLKSKQIILQMNIVNYPS